MYALPSLRLFSFIKLCFPYSLGIVAKAESSQVIWNQFHSQDDSVRSRNKMSFNCELCRVFSGKMIFPICHATVKDLWWSPIAICHGCHQQANWHWDGMYIKIAAQQTIEPNRFNRYIAQHTIHPPTPLYSITYLYLSLETLDNDNNRCCGMELSFLHFNEFLRIDIDLCMAILPRSNYFLFK